MKRTARWFEIELITTGGGQLLTQDEIVPVRPGMVFFHSPGRVVQGTAPYTCDVVAFDAEYSADRETAYHDINWLNYDHPDVVTGQGQLPVDLPAYFHLPDPLSVAATFRKMQSLFHQRGATPQLALKQALFEILLNLSEGLRDISGHLSVHQERLDQLCRYIDANPEGKFVLHDLAAMVNLSPNFLCRIFKESTGLTLFQYIHRRKIDTACSLLFETKLPIKAVALEVGIENQSYFHDLFKRLRGMTPAEYRQRNRYWVSL
jgi:AraC-like DNA-binding protein